MEYLQIIPNSILLLQGTVLAFGVPKQSVDSMETAWKPCPTRIGINSGRVAGLQ